MSRKFAKVRERARHCAAATEIFIASDLGGGCRWGARWGGAPSRQFSEPRRSRRQVYRAPEQDWRPAAAVLLRSRPVRLWIASANDKIHGPAGVGGRLDQDRRPRPRGAPPSPSLANREAFFAIKPVDAVDARGLALLPQQDEQRTISETLPLVGEIAQLRPKLRVRRPARAVTDHLAVSADDRAGPPLRQAHRGPKTRDAFALDSAPTIFLTEAREARRHPTSARLGASSVWRSRPRVGETGALPPQGCPDSRCLSHSGKQARFLRSDQYYCRKELRRSTLIGRPAP